MTIHYEILNGKNFNTYSLDHFVRHQQVSECWRNVGWTVETDTDRI